MSRRVAQVVERTVEEKSENVLSADRHFRVRGQASAFAVVASLRHGATLHGSERKHRG